MRLNPDCLRSIILLIESKSKLGKYYESSKLFVDLYSEYGSEVVDYHANYLDEANLIKIEARLISGNYIVDDLTPKGHEFANNVRDDGVWKETKSNAEKIGSFAINILSQVASNIIQAKLKEYLG